jgi:hypothetical protein
MLYWGTQAYAIQQILLRGLPNLDFTIRPSERKFWDPQFSSPFFLIVEPAVGRKIQLSGEMLPAVRVGTVHAILLCPRDTGEHAQSFAPAVLATHADPVPVC